MIKLKRPLDIELEALRKRREVPIVVITWQPDETFGFYLTHDVSPEDAIALLEKLDLKLSFK